MIKIQKVMQHNKNNTRMKKISFMYNPIHSFSFQEKNNPSVLKYILL